MKAFSLLRSSALSEWVLSHLTYFIFTLVTIFFLIFAPNFASISAAASLLRVTALVSIMAVGTTFVIICGEIDLSVGALASFTGMIAAMLIDRGTAAPVAIGLVFLLGAAIGAGNGFLVTRLKIPSFLVTLGMMGILSGLALTVTNTMPVSIIDDEFNGLFWNGSIWGLPVPVAWTVLIAAAGFYLLHLSIFGRRVYATGGNVVAAQFSGVRTNRVKIWAFIFSSLTASLAGLMLAARSSGANPTSGDGLELDVIAAVIVGGTSLFGGYGSVPGSVIGAIFIGIVQFGLLTTGYTTSISASHQRRDHSGSRLVESTLRAFVLRAGLPYCWVRIAFRPPEWSTQKAGGSDLKSIWSKLPYRSMA